MNPVLFVWCARRDLNPHGFPLEPKSSASANSATRAYTYKKGFRHFLPKPKTSGISHLCRRSDYINLVTPPGIEPGLPP